LSEEPNFPVLVVDDDEQFGDSMIHLLAAHRYAAEVFSSAEAFLDKRLLVPRPAIALVDVKMPGKSGLDMLVELSDDPKLAVVMMTGHGDVPLAVRAIQKGALEFLEKPFPERKLLDALEVAADELKRRFSAWSNQRNQAEKLAQLSPRERDVLKLVSEGHNSKQVAGRLGLSVRTVEMHRANLVRRLNFRTMAEAMALYLETGIK